MNDRLKRALETDIVAIDTALMTALSETDGDYAVLFDSMRYSVQAGGKRIRPFLVMQFCRLFGGDADCALPFACAIEMVHTYSLIHDDLPCMDNDDLRRGKPTNHIVFGQSTALLAGDALLTRAFSVLTEAQCAPERILDAVRLLAHNAGENGMIGGQQMDLLGEDHPYELDRLIKMHAKKTGALISCACQLGVLAAGYDCDSDACRAAQEYAAAIGLAFQITDDILDAYGSQGELGKPIGSDANNGKTTFLSLMNRAQAHDYAARLTEQAKAAVAPMQGGEILSDFADYLLDRTK